MRKALLTSILLAGSVLAATPALADDAPAAAAPTPAFTITGAADVATQYRFRGISQSNNKAVFQGAFTITHSSGFYLSTWGSSANEGNSWVDIGGTEIDVYGGYSHTFSGFTVDGGLYGYIYPGSTHAYGETGLPNQSYFEVYGDVSKTFGPVTAKAGVNFAPDQHYFHYLSNGGTKHNAYVFGELGLAIPNFPITFHSHVGHTAGGFDYGPNAKQYLDYTVGASYKWKALTFDVSVVGTNLSKSDNTAFFDDGEGGTSSLYYNDAYRAAKSVVVGTITASF